MFTLTLHDRNGTELNLGDIVKISDGKHFVFFAEVKYLDKEKVITPFHTFTFHSFVKVDKVPAKAIKSTEERYDIWFMPDEDEEDTDAASFETYLNDWRLCEHKLQNRCWRITKS